MDAAVVTSTVGLWTAVFMLRVWHFGNRHLGVLQPVNKSAHICIEAWLLGGLTVDG